MFETEFLIYAIKQGFKVGFVEIETIYRGEKSYMRYATETKKLSKAGLERNALFATCQKPLMYLA
jgi:hypothetical protein